MKIRKIIVFALCTVVFTTVAGCQSQNKLESKTMENQSTFSNSVSEPSSDTAETSSSETLESVSSEEPESSVLELGTEGTLKDWSVTVSSSISTDRISDNDYLFFSPKEGNLFLSVSVTIKNNGKKADTFLPSYGIGDDISAKVLYGDGYEYSSTNLMGYKYELHNEVLNPLSSMDGEITFEIPTEIAESSDALVLRFTSGKESISFRLR